MLTTIERVTEANASIFINLWQYLGYDFSEMNHMALNAAGTYTLPEDIATYYQDQNYVSYLIKVDGEIAGLAVIKFFKEPQENYFRHYFIMRKFRGLGIGEKVAVSLFDLYSGQWRISQFDYNEPAIRFWRKVVHNYTQGVYQEDRRTDNKGPQQRFSSK